MSDFNAVWEKTRLRFALGGAVFVAGLICAHAAGEGLERLFCSLVFAFFLAVIIGPPLCELLAEPGRDVFYPIRRFDRPQPIYGAPAGKRARGQYEEAIAGYQQLAANYPEELQPHLAMIEIAAIDLKDPERARGFYQHGMALFTDPGCRDVLSRHFEAQLSRLAGKPEWLKKQASRTLNIQKKTDSAPVDEPDGVTQRRFHPGGHNRL